MLCLTWLFESRRCNFWLLKLLITFWSLFYMKFITEGTGTEEKKWMVFYLSANFQAFQEDLALWVALWYTIQQFTIQQCTIHVYINYISFFACHHSYSLHSQVFYEIGFSNIMLNLWWSLFPVNKFRPL